MLIDPAPTGVQRTLLTEEHHGPEANSEGPLSRAMALSAEPTPWLKPSNIAFNQSILPDLAFNQAALSGIMLTDFVTASAPGAPLLSPGFPQGSSALGMAINAPGIFFPGPSKQELEAKFRRLADQWKLDTAYSSSTTERFLHPAHLQIIGMGSDALPFILCELRDHGGHWGLALSSITGENPVPAEHYGKGRLVAAAWVEWGRANKHLS